MNVPSEINVYYRSYYYYYYYYYYYFFNPFALLV